MILAQGVGGMRRALITAPMSSELRPVVNLSHARRGSVDGRTVYEGRAGSIEIQVVQIGVGPDLAREVTEWALSRFEIDHVVVSGIAGGLAADLPVGSVVVPEAVLDIRNGECYQSAPLGAVERRGLIATADHLVVDAEQLRGLEAQGVIAMEMESSGVAAACQSAGVPWTTFRVIGDRPDGHMVDMPVMDLLRADGTPDVGRAIRLVATHPSRIPSLMRLARDSSMAATKAARTALAALSGAPGS